MTDTQGGTAEDLSVTIIIPAFNESAAIEGVINRLKELYPAYEIIVVDDGSTDRTGESAEQAGATVIRHSWNRGYGAALRTGLQKASGRIVCTFDGDGQHVPEDLAKLLERIHEADMVVGVRSKDSHRPLCRRPGKLILSFFADFLTGTRIPDVNSGLRVFRRDVLLKYLHLMPEGFSFSTTATFAFLKGGHRIAWVPVTTRRRLGKSSVSQLRHGFETLLLMLRLTALFDPLKVFLPVSVAFMLVAVGFFIANLLAGRTVPRTSIIMSVSSVTIFMMGLIMDQVAAIRRELHK